MRPRPRVALAALVLLILAMRLPFLPQSPDDIDAVNFTLGVRDFDIAQHRPHPPGYPILIALGKLAAPIFTAAAGAGVPAYQVEARVIAFWSILAAALSVLVLPSLFLSFEAVRDRRSDGADGQPDLVPAGDGAYGRAMGATVLTISAPLFWLTTGRPMSDVPGLVLGAAATALLASALWRQQALARSADPAALPGADSPIVASGRLIVLGALTAGVAIGLRSQSAWFTVPLLVFVLLNRIGRGVLGATIGSAMTFTIGVLSWAVPLVMASGGPRSYVYAFSVQAGEDLAGVRMLAFEPDARRLALALNDTFVQPWHWPVLGWIVTALAVTGVLSMLVRNRRGLVALAVAFGPYAVFHLLFQDTTFVRYALPLLPAVAYLAIAGIGAISPRRGTPLAAGLLVAASLAAAVPLSVAYAREAAPVYRAYAAVAHQGADASTLAVHHNVAQALRGETMPRPLLPSPLRHEWLEVVRHWRENGAGPIWFLADARRTDLASFDPATQQVIGRYRWSFDHLPLMQGVRPGAIDVVRLDAPGWMTGAGWALTPELAGIARRDGTELGRRPIEALVRRRSEPTVLMIGGRNLGAKGTPDVRFVVTLDGQPLDTVASPPDPGFFLRFLPLPAGRLSGEGAFATLRVAAESADGSARPIEAGVEQFDLQPATSVLFGFDAGWNEREYNPITGRMWRWTTASSPVRVLHAGQDVTVTIEGESPLKTFPTAPRITLRAGAEVLEQASPTDDFTITARVPAAVLERAGGTVTIDTTQVFVPSDRDAGSTDHRQLGLRIYRVDVRSAAGVR